MMTLVLRLLAILLALVVLPAVSIGPAFAQASDAARLKAEGDALMGDIKYQEALEKYEQAYKISADPALLYNQGRALEALTRYPEALEKLKAFDAKAPPDLHARVPNLKKLISDVEGRTTLLTVAVKQKGATIKLGDRVLGTAPLPQTRVNAGKVKIEVSLEGFDTSVREVELPRAGTKSEAFDLVPRDKTAVLAIDSPVKGATVRVDGGPPVQVPTEARLPPGKHVVSLEAEGYEDNTVDVELRAAERRTLTIEPGETPVYERWWFWTIWGGVLAGAGASVLTYALLTEGAPDEGTIPPCQLVVNAEGSDCTPTAAQALRHVAPARGTHRAPGAFTIGPIPVFTLKF
jgi:hypothetical protein